MVIKVYAVLTVIKRSLLCSSPIFGVFFVFLFAIGTILCRVLIYALISLGIFFALFWDLALDFPNYLAYLFPCSVGFISVLNFYILFFLSFIFLSVVQAGVGWGGGGLNCTFYIFGSRAKKKGVFLSLLASFSSYLLLLYRATSTDSRHLSLAVSLYCLRLFRLIEKN